MNIFVTSECPKESAKYLDDKRTCKMVLETAQLLSTAVRLAGREVGYKATHANHPCSIWTRESSANFDWVVDHGLALAAEYSNRYGRVHKSEEVIRILAPYRYLFPAAGLTPFANCTDYKDKNTLMAYQLHLGNKWSADYKEPTWYGIGVI